MEKKRLNEMTLNTEFKKTKIIILVSVFLFTVLGLSYAFFITGVLGTGKDMTITSANLTFVYIDGNEILLEEVEPGEMTSKVFTIQNRSNEGAYYKIEWDIVENTYDPSKEVIYNLESIDGGTNVSDTQVPIETVTIADMVYIAGNTTHTYTFDVKFVDTGSLQNYNQEKILNAKINVESYEPDQSTTTYDTGVLSMTLDGENITNIPTSSGYSLTSYSCTNGVMLGWDSSNAKLIASNITSIPYYCTLNFVSITTTLTQKIYEDNEKLPSRTDFASAFNDTTTGNIYYVSTNTESVCDNDDTLTYVSGSGNNSVCKTYFFAGNTTNNYVVFAGFMWRIVRINEDQSVRLILQGDEDLNTSNNNNGSLGVGSYFSFSNDNTYLGYKYGTTGASSYNDTHSNSIMSTVAVSVDTFYNQYIQKKYNSYVSPEAIYCNDRSVISGNGIGTSVTTYGGYNRLITNKAPQFKCPQENDKYTISSNTGNAALSSPIALLTADESMYAGAFLNTSASTNYLFHNSAFSSIYTMTPSNFDASGAYIFGIHNGTTPLLINNDINIRPVLSLKSCVRYTGGNGNLASPYKVTIDNACASATN